MPLAAGGCAGSSWAWFVCPGRPVPATIGQRWLPGRSLAGLTEWRSTMVRAGRRISLLAMIMILGAGLSAVVGSGAVQAAPMMGRAAPGESVPLIPGELDSVSA